VQVLVQVQVSGQTKKTPQGEGRLQEGQAVPLHPLCLARSKDLGRKTSTLPEAMAMPSISVMRWSCEPRPWTFGLSHQEMRKRVRLLRQLSAGNWCAQMSAWAKCVSGRLSLGRPQICKQWCKGRRNFLQQPRGTTGRSPALITSDPQLSAVSLFLIVLGTQLQILEDNSSRPYSPKAAVGTPPRLPRLLAKPSLAAPRWALSCLSPPSAASAHRSTVSGVPGEGTRVGRQGATSCRLAALHGPLGVSVGPLTPCTVHVPRCFVEGGCHGVSLGLREMRPGLLLQPVLSTPGLQRISHRGAYIKSRLSASAAARARNLLVAVPQTGRSRCRRGKLPLPGLHESLSLTS